MVSVQPVTYVKGQCYPRRYKKFKDVTVFPELWTKVNESMVSVQPVTYVKGQCYPRRYKKFKSITVMPELWEYVNSSTTHKISYQK